MIDPKTFNAVSQMAHWLGGCLGILAPVFLFGQRAMWPAIIIVALFAAIKEFWYDFKYENTEVRGSSLEDFFFYIIGILLGIALIAVRGL